MATKRSPAMEQFFRAKQAYPDAILFFRLGDFYEMFCEDAVVASRAARPHADPRRNDAHGDADPDGGRAAPRGHGLHRAAARAGPAVAICEQMADPAKVKGDRAARGRARHHARPRPRPRCARRARAQLPGLPSLHADAQRFGLGRSLELSTGELRACRARQTRADALAELVRAGRARGAARAGGALELRAQLERAAAARGVPHARRRRRRRCAAADARLARSCSTRARRTNGSPRSSCRAAARALRYAQDVAARRAARRPARSRRTTRAVSCQLDEAAVRNLELVETLGGRAQGLAARTCSTRPGRRWARACCAAGCSRR